MKRPRPQAEEVAGASASTGLSSEEVRDYMSMLRVSSLEGVKLGKFKEVGRAVGRTAVGSERIRRTRPSKGSATTCRIDPPIVVRVSLLLAAAVCLCAPDIPTIGRTGGMS